MADNDKPCCKEFAEESDNVGAFVGGGMLYPKAMRPSAQIEWAEGGWHVNGCCGGGCFVLTNIKFCPFCGTKLLPGADE